jgi:hypothetical protein
MQAFFKECDVHDLVDTVTVIYGYLHRNDDFLSKKSAEDYNPYEAWRYEVDRIFREEHLAYRLDGDAGVHPLVDTEFEVNRASALWKYSTNQGSARCGGTSRLHTVTCATVTAKKLSG